MTKTEHSLVEKVLERASGSLLDLLAFAQLAPTILGSARRSKATSLEITLLARNVGFFAQLNWVIYLADYALKNQCLPVVYLCDENYLDPDTSRTDWLEHFFEMDWRDNNRALSSKPVRAKISKLNRALPRYSKLLDKMTLSRAHDLAAMFLRPQMKIREDVGKFIKHKLGERYIGVHLRGTDKFFEAPPVRVENSIKTIARLLKTLDRQPESVFLASDEQALVVEFRRCAERLIPNLPVVTRDHLRSTDSQPIHLDRSRTGEMKRKLGEEALVDCLLLAQSCALVRTSSFLSGWASVFNPALPVYLLNRPFERSFWFPDRQVFAISKDNFRRLPSD